MWKVEKRTQKERLKNKMQKKYIGFFYLFLYFKKRKKRETGHSKQFEEMQRKATF